VPSGKRDVANMHANRASAETNYFGVPLRFSRPRYRVGAIVKLTKISIDPYGLVDVSVSV
jgi:hypothetical protein